MSRCDLRLALERIKNAPLDSPIAVFKVPGESEKVDVVFANTFNTKTRIAARDPMLIGIFDSFWPKYQVEVLIRARLEPALKRKGDDDSRSLAETRRAARR